MASKARITLRFSVNRKGVQSAAGDHQLKNKFRNGVRVIIPTIAINYAQDKYDELVATVKAQIKRDADREITNIAQHYQRIIIGAGPTLTGPSKRSVKTHAEGGPTVQSMAGGVPPWPRRTRDYLRWKERHNLPANWFLAKTGHMQDEMKWGGTWTGMFGPVEVSIQRKVSTDQRTKQAGSLLKRAGGDVLSGGDFGKTRVGIAQIKVSALGKITLPMLRNYKAKSPMMGLVYNYDNALGHRLAGRTGLHRPTLQPFLEFVLTKAIPYAVQRRISLGLNAKINRTGKHTSEWFVTRS